MRKILSQEEIEKRDRRKKLWISIVLIGVMVLSSLGYAFFSSDSGGTGSTTNKISYGGLEFKQTDNGPWEFQISGYTFKTQFNPEETSNISVIITKTLQDYQNKILYFGVNSIEDITQDGNQEIVSNLGQFILRANLACLSESCTEDYPIKNCSGNEIIIFNKDNGGITKIRDKEDCVYVDYIDSKDEIRAADALLFKILGL